MAPARAVFVGADCLGFLPPSTAMIVRIEDSSHLALARLELDGLGLPVDGVEARGGDPVHHLTLEDLHIHDLGATNQTNAISSFVPAWDWEVRGLLIENVGTGMYLGESDGEAPFARGLIEDSVFFGHRGYGIQVKQQNGRPGALASEPSPLVTRIRRNVFIKDEAASTGSEGRPSLLLGHAPLFGPGQDDGFEVEDNLFAQNPAPSEALVQAEGNLRLHDNVLVNDHAGPGVWIRPHHDWPRRILVERNTLLTRGPSIVVEGLVPGAKVTVERNLAVCADADCVPRDAELTNCVFGPSWEEALFFRADRDPAFLGLGPRLPLFAPRPLGPLAHETALPSDPDREPWPPQACGARPFAKAGEPRR